MRIKMPLFLKDLIKKLEVLPGFQIPSCPNPAD